MIKVDRELKKNNHTDVRLLIQLHDELLYEIPESKVETMKVSNPIPSLPPALKHPINQGHDKGSHGKGTEA